MSVERGVRFELLSRLCPNATGADIRRRVWGGEGNGAVCNLRRMGRMICSMTAT